MRTFSISASKIANICGKNYHEGEELHNMVMVLWRQLDPASYNNCFPATVEDIGRKNRRSSSPIRFAIPDEYKKLCEDSQLELESIPEENYLRAVHEKREALWKKIEPMMKNNTADEKTAINSFVRSSMHGWYGCRSEDKILDVFETLTSTTIQRKVQKRSRDFEFVLGGESIRMMVFGTPDGFLDENTDSFRILECKAKMGSDRPTNLMIKDYLQAITYNIIYDSDQGPRETLLLSHFESIKTDGNPKLLKFEDKTLSEWFIKHVMEEEWNEHHKLDEPIIENIDSETVETQLTSRAGLLRIVHISADDARRVWAKAMERIRLLLMVVLTIIYNPHWQQGWMSTHNKAMFVDDAMRSLPEYYL